MHNLVVYGSLSSLSTPGTSRSCHIQEFFFNVRRAILQAFNFRRKKVEKKIYFVALLKQICLIFTANRYAVAQYFWYVNQTFHSPNFDPDREPALSSFSLLLQLLSKHRQLVVDTVLRNQIMVAQFMKRGSPLVVPCEFRVLVSVS
jgi:hypothetical protein